MGGKNIDNYSPDFILKLSEYSNNLNYSQLEKSDKEFISEFAKRWPSKISEILSIEFIHNNALMMSMLKIKKKARVQETKELLDLLGEKSLLYPEIMQKHYKSLFLMKNKEQLTEYMENFIQKTSQLGYGDFDVTRLIMALRLIHPDVKGLDPEIALDFLVLLSNSDIYIKNLDSKSVKYINGMLDMIEERYSGKRIANVQMPK